MTNNLQVQDQYMRELHGEKRALMKKVQECDELRMGFKFLEQKCASYQAKLDEKDSALVRLKQKYIQLEQDTNKIEYEYQRLRNQHSSVMLGNGNCSGGQAPPPPPSHTDHHAFMSNSTNLMVNMVANAVSNTANNNNNQISNAAITTTSASSSSSNSPTALNAHRTRASTNAEALDLDSYYRSKSINNMRSSSALASTSSTSAMRHLDHSDDELLLLTDQHQHQHQHQTQHQQHQQHQPFQQQTPQQQQRMSVDEQMRYIEKLESEFDWLMKQKHDLDAQLTRVPQKLTNTNMQMFKKNIENELNSVDKKLASVKLELRKLNIIKSH